jgi:AcrR family transcriptional regulator
VTPGARGLQIATTPSPPLPGTGTGRLQPTSARGRRTRAALVAAAREVFRRDGYAEATATAVTAEAGVGYGSFYVYFSSKEEIFVEVVQELLEAVYIESRAPQEEDDPAERLAYENRRYFQLYRDNARLFDQLQQAVRTEPAVRDAWLAMRREYNSRLARSFVRLQADGRMNADLDPVQMADALGAMAERTAYLSTIDPDLDVEALQNAVSAIWSHTLGLAPASQAPARRATARRPRR